MESMVPDYRAHTASCASALATSSAASPPRAPTRDRDGGWIVIGGNSDGIFKRFMHSDRAKRDLAEDPRLRDNPGPDTGTGWSSTRPSRKTGRERRRSSRRWRSMTEAHVPAGPIYSVADFVDDPHFQAREMVLEREVGVDGKSEPMVFPASCRSRADARPDALARPRARRAHKRRC